MRVQRTTDALFLFEDLKRANHGITLGDKDNLGY